MTEMIYKIDPRESGFSKRDTYGWSRQGYLRPVPAVPLGEHGDEPDTGNGNTVPGYRVYPGNAVPGYVPGPGVVPVHGLNPGNAVPRYRFYPGNTVPGYGAYPGNAVPGYRLNTGYREPEYMVINGNAVPVYRLNTGYEEPGSDESLNKKDQIPFQIPDSGFIYRPESSDGQFEKGSRMLAVVSNNPCDPCEPGPARAHQQVQDLTESSDETIGILNPESQCHVFKNSWREKIANFNSKYCYFIVSIDHNDQKSANLFAETCQKILNFDRNFDPWWRGSMATAFKSRHSMAVFFNPDSDDEKLITIYIGHLFRKVYRKVCRNVEKIVEKVCRKSL
jgi:hypothetical protein